MAEVAELTINHIRILAADTIVYYVDYYGGVKEHRFVEDDLFTDESEARQALKAYAAGLAADIDDAPLKQEPERRKKQK
jgi:hypothetical protein